MISMRLYPCDDAFAACYMTLVSNSSDCMEKEATLFEPHGYQHKDLEDILIRSCNSNFTLIKVRLGNHS